MSSEGVTVTSAEEYPVFESFDDYDLNENLLRGIYSYGFEKPSSIQQCGIKPILDGRDTIGQAQFGTRKIATFVIGVLQRIDWNVKGCQGLILAPTQNYQSDSCSQPRRTTRTCSTTAGLNTLPPELRDYTPCEFSSP